MPSDTSRLLDSRTVTLDPPRIATFPLETFCFERESASHVGGDVAGRRSESLKNRYCGFRLLRERDTARFAPHYRATSGVEYSVVMLRVRLALGRILLDKAVYNFSYKLNGSHCGTLCLFPSEARSNSPLNVSRRSLSRT